MNLEYNTLWINLTGANFSFFQAYIAVYTPPKCVTDIINGLTQQQRNALVAGVDVTGFDPLIEAAANRVLKVVKKKIANLSPADSKTVSDWETALDTFCLQYFEMLYAYSYS